MFAGFDFKIDSQENLINFSDYAIQGKNHLDSSKAAVERNLKEIVINGTESLDGSSIQGEWFPEINADIFISHSHDDADLANGIAGWINSNFNLHCFIDSNVWGYSDELLEKLNSRYSNKRPNSNGGYLYDHQSCINASKHVDTMLTIALHMPLREPVSISTGIVLELKHVGMEKSQWP